MTDQDKAGPVWAPTVGGRAIVHTAEQASGRACAEVIAGDQVTLDWRAGDEWAVTTDDERGGMVAARHLRPVPDAPTPTTEPAQDEPWRVGEHYGIHVYAVEPKPEGEPECPACAGFTPEHDGGAAEHVPNPDRPVATFHRPEDAARAVADRARVAELERLVEDYSRNLATRDAELTEARAETARVRADHDRLLGGPLPEVEVRDTPHGARGAYLDGKYVTGVSEEGTTEWIAMLAAAWGALYRDRLDRVAARTAPDTTPTVDDDAALLRGRISGWGHGSNDEARAAVDRLAAAARAARTEDGERG